MSSKNNLTNVPQPLTVEEVLSQVDDSTPKYKSAFFHGIEVNIGISNLKVFKNKGVVCKHCNIVGNVFYIERNGALEWSKYSEWHLNLYAQNLSGQRVMLTKDHILPKSKGGPDTLDNYQTLCENCNSRKGNKFEDGAWSLDKTKSTIKAILNFNDEKVAYCFNKCQSGMKDKYHEEINEEDYSSMVEKATGKYKGTVKIVHVLSVNKTIREIEFRGKQVWLIYNTADRVINTVMEPRPYKDYFRFVPHWAKEMEQAVLADYDKILDDAKSKLIDKGTEKDTALYFRTLKHSKLMFCLWKDKPFGANDYIWRVLKEKYTGSVEAGSDIVDRISHVSLKIPGASVGIIKTDLAPKQLTPEQKERKSYWWNTLLDKIKIKI